MSYRAAALFVFGVLGAVTLAAQAPGGAAPDAQARRVTDRMRALQGEADRLASEARTLVGDLRKLEIERDLRGEEAARAEAASTDGRRSVQQITDRISALEQQRTAQLPDLKAQLVDVYKRGRTGYARLLFAADDLRDFARATRAVGALTSINERRIEEHRRTIDALRTERESLKKTAQELQTRETEARQARAAAQRAVNGRAELLAQIDSRRDLTAQYVGELQVAYDRIQQQVAGLNEGKTAETVAVPLAPFQGALEWPVPGRIVSRFGQASDRLGGGLVRNGIEIAAPEETPVHAVHGGTVGFADPFTGFGNLVIIDHGTNNYSVYGYLNSTTVERGDAVESGAELGRVGLSPAGPAALYFEMRIDGRSVNPVQWLKIR